MTPNPPWRCWTPGRNSTWPCWTCACHGAFNYLLKPADIDDLVRELRAAHERKLRQEENARMIEAGKLASIGRLAEGVAHEINNPVNIMTNAAGWIEDLLDEPDLASSPPRWS